MILVRSTLAEYPVGENIVHWSEHTDAESVEALIASMSKAMESENASRPRSFEVFEVEVKRRVTVEREVAMVATVSVKEDVK